MNTNSSAGIEALRRAQERWNAGDLNGYLSIYREDAVMHGYAGVGPGFANIKAFYEGFWTAFPDSRLLFDEVFAADDKVVCRFVVQGVHTGTFQGMPPTGRKFSVPGITILRFVEGQCVERWSQTDFLSLLQQLGAFPS
jgi:steroid delta-isomerase-like uncharacterized protein